MTYLAIAINSAWKDKDGNKREETEFIDVAVFGKQAESCVQYLEKGQEVLITGRIKNRTIDDRGEKRKKTGILADRVQFGRKSGGNTQTEGEPATEGQTSAKKATSYVSEPIDYPTDDINPEDIPF